MKSGSRSTIVTRIIQIATLLNGIVLGFMPHQNHFSRKGQGRLWSSNYGGQEEQAVEALRSLVDFHEGRWKGKARSFSVVPDTAAGIVQRKVSSDYETSVKFGVNSDRDYSITETFAWDEGKFKARSLALSECNVDVDAVDASYSMDYSLPDFPVDIIGTDKLCHFAIEHCIAASEDKRLRCFVLYTIDQSLQRIVVCEETRLQDGSGDAKPMQGISNQLTAQDILEIQNDVDRLVDRLTGNMPSVSEPAALLSTEQPSSPDSLIQKLGQSIESDDGAQKLSLHDISLLEVSSGVWLGDAIIRDNPKVSGDPSLRSRGFGPSAPETLSTYETRKEFAAWSVGVQKVVWRWMWNFGDEIRQVVDAGKAMGDPLSECLTKSLPGTVCVNESLSRRMAKEDRMVYIDWTNNMVGFLIGPMFIQVPRYLSFGQKGSTNKPFYTEFAVFQSTESQDGIIRSATRSMDEDGGNMNLSQLCLSKISRVYNQEGRLKQGCTSFFTFKRFGIDDMDE